MKADDYDESELALLMTLQALHAGALDSDPVALKHALALLSGKGWVTATRPDEPPDAPATWAVTRAGAREISLLKKSRPPWLL